MGFENLSAMHRKVADRLGQRAALRHKRDGMYFDLSWQQYRSTADYVAAALIGLGVDHGDRIGLLSENRYEWLMSDIAILATGAADVPMHAPLSSKQIEYQLGHSEAKGVIVSSQAQAKKVIEALPNLPKLKFVVSMEPVDFPRGRAAYTFSGLRQRGFLLGAKGQIAVRDRESAITRDALATIIYTSGTTGLPKGVMLTHGNILSNAETMLQVVQTSADDWMLSWLPYSHIYARTVDHYSSIISESTLCLAESVDTLLVNLAETQPTWMTAVPRFYEKVWSAVEHLPADVRAAQLKKIFGRRLRFLSSGGAPLPKHVGKGFHECGILLLEGYGLTESSPVIAFNRPDCYRVGSVGKPIAGVEVKIAADGEILTRGPHVMKGYLKNPEATAETIIDGWLHTGDVGILDDDGFLFITDRKKDLIVTSSGKNVAPSEIERLLVADPFIDQAVVHGDDRNFLTALIVPAFAGLETKAKELGWSLEKEGEFLIDAELHAFLAERVAHALKDVSNVEKVKKFLVMARPFALEADELTATLKVRRRHLIQKYRNQLDALYAGPVPAGVAAEN